MSKNICQRWSAPFSKIGKLKRWQGAAILFAAAISLAGAGCGKSNPASSLPDIPIIPLVTTPSSATSSLTLQTNEQKSYMITLHTTAGDIEIALNDKETPKTVQNFVDLARKNFYNNTIFHRVIKGFMIQGGDPNGDGTGGPGYKFDDEPFTGDYTRGAVAMANSGPNTNGSQFFIMHADVALPKNYIIFGHVAKGLDVVDKIAESPVGPNQGGEPSKPLNPVKVTSVDVAEK